MADERRFRSLYSYLEFGVRLHLDEFSQLTGVVLIVFLPLAALALSLHPPLGELLRSSGNSMSLLSRMLVSQLLMRVVQTFIFILLILKMDSSLRGEGNVWDIAEALARLKRVVLVDLAYVFGLQALAVLLLWLALLAMAAFFGQGRAALPLAAFFAGLIVLGPAIRYYFCTFASLLHGTTFVESFRVAGTIVSGAERLVITIVAVYMLAWFFIWQLVQGVFGASFFAQICVQAAVMVTSISYFFATYRLYVDLSLEESNRLIMEEEEVLPPAEREDPRREEEERPEED